MITKQQFESCPFKRIVFDHKPKCAGTTINRMFHGLFNYARLDGLGNIDFDETGRRLESTCVNDWSEDVIYMSAHYLFLPENFTPQEDDFYFTFIRHPVELLFSNYYFVNFRINNSPQCVVNRQWSEDTQKVFLLPINDFVKHMLTIGKKNIPLTNYFYNLDKYNFVGVVEKIHQSIESIAHILNIDLLASVDVPMLNVCPTQKSLTMVDELTDMFSDEINIWNTYYESI
jgi:hypothetical protein